MWRSVWLHLQSLSQCSSWPYSEKLLFTVNGKMQRPRLSKILRTGDCWVFNSRVDVIWLTLRLGEHHGRGSGDPGRRDWECSLLESLPLWIWSQSGCSCLQWLCSRVNLSTVSNGWGGVPRALPLPGGKSLLMGMVAGGTIFFCCVHTC